MKDSDQWFEIYSLSNVCTFCLLIQCYRLSGVEGAFDAPGAKTVIPKKVFIAFYFL